MNEDQKKAYEEHLDLLPVAHQEVIRSYPWQDHVVSIGTGQKLYLDQIDSLYAEVALVLVGAIDVEDIQDELVERLFIEESQAESLVRALNLEIFNPIREAIQKKLDQTEAQFIQPTQVFTPVATHKPQTHINSLKTKPTDDPYREPIE